MSGAGRSGLPVLALAFCAGAALPRSDHAIAVAAAGLPLVATGAPGAVVGFGALGWSVSSAVRARAPDPGDALRSPDRPGERPPGPTRGESWLEGVVDGAPETFGPRVRFTLRERAGSRVLVWADAPALPLALGDAVRLAAVVRIPEGARNPGGRDARALLAARGVSEEAFARGPPIRIAPPSPLSRVEAARKAFARVAAATLEPRQAALVTAISTGERDGLDTATNDAFARSGLAHVLSVSGLHLSVVVYGFFRIVQAALLRLDRLCAHADPRRLAASVSIPVAALYAAATGASVPVVRSAIATGAGFAAIALLRETDPLHTISLALLAIVAFDPGSLGDPSFQLSFASVASLALFTRPLRDAVRVGAPGDGAGWRRRAGEWLLQSLCASLAASLGTAAIVACHFRRLPLAGVIANIPGVPISSALTIAATAAALASAACPALCTPLLLVCRPFAWALLAVNDLFANLPGAAPALASPGPICAAASSALGILAWRLRGRSRAAAASAAAAAVLFLVGPGPFRAWAAASRGDVLEVVFLSVGQADCAFLRLPDGSAVLVDAGADGKGRVEAGTRDIVPFLRDAGVRRIAAVFLSHGDADHVVAIPALAREFGIDAVFTSGAAVDERAGAALAGAPTPRHLAAGDAWARGGVRFEVLAPRGDPGSLDENDGSMVVRVTHGDSALLFLGDVQAEGERALLAAEDPRHLRADVVKVPHHGSRTSSGAGLVSAARPSLAVISVGKDNRFGFPAPEVVARWAGAGAEVARTDAGAVRVLSDGRTVRVSPAGAALSGVALLAERL